MTTGLPEKENEELLRELDRLRRQVDELQAVDAKRCLAEEALRQSEERYRLVMEGIEDAYWELDLAGNTTFFNDCAARIHDCTPADLMGRNYQDYMEEGAAREIMEKFKEIYRTGNPATGLVWEVVRDDGSKRILESNVSLIRDGAGKATGFRGISRDMTERRQAEESLRQREERYRTIIEEMPDNYWELDLDGHFTFINEQLMKMQGRSREELIGLDTLQFLDEGSLKNWRRRLKEVYRTGEAQRGIPYQLTRKNGEILDMEANVSLLRDGDGNPVGFRGVSRNVTERKQIEEALRQSEERFRLVAQATNDAVWDWDLLTNSLWRNEGFETLFGYRREELESGIDSSYNRIHPDDLERIAAGLRAVIDNDKSIWSDEYRFCRADGSYAYILDRAYVIRDELGKPVRMIGAMLDMSSLKQAEEQFRLVVESSPNGFVMTDQRGEVLLINAEIERLFGYRREELIGKSIELLVPDNFRDLHRQLREAYMQAPQRRGMNRERSLKGKRKDGREFPAEIGLTPIRTPQGLRIVGVVTDITERKQAEDALRQSEERYRTVIEEMTDSFWETDLFGHFTFFNNQVVIEQQRSPEELLNNSGMPYLDDENRRLL
jgi:PAS domain S-box-containing protein